MFRLSVRGLAALLSLAALTGCSNPSDLESNLSREDAAGADRNLEKRVQATLRFRELAKKIENALDPVDATLRDVKAILELEGDRVKGELPAFAITELRYAMQELAREGVVRNEDGSWSIKRKVEWPFERLVEGAKCDSSEVEMRGQDMSWESGKAGWITVSVTDCSIGTAEALAAILVDEKGAIRVDFDSMSATKLKDTEIKADRCALEIGAKSRVSLDCKPFTAKLSKALLKFDGIAFEQVEGIRALSVKVGAWKADGSPIGGVLFEQKPYEKLRPKRLSKEEI